MNLRYPSLSTDEQIILGIKQPRRERCKDFPIGARVRLSIDGELFGLRPLWLDARVVSYSKDGRVRFQASAKSTRTLHPKLLEVRT